MLELEQAEGEDGVEIENEEGRGNTTALMTIEFDTNANFVGCQTRAREGAMFNN